MGYLTNILFLLLLSSSFINAQELTPDQLELVKQAVNENNATYTDSESVDEIDDVIEPQKDTVDSNLSIQGKKYGYDFFSTIATSISARGDLPLPNDYKISLRDQSVAA